MRFWSWKIFGNVILGHRNFFSCEFFVGMGNDELNFCVAKPQESRQSPNVEKCIGSNEASFGTFIEVLLNQETHEYKDF